MSDGTAGLMVTIPGLVAAVAAPLLTIAFGRMDRRTIVLGLIGLLTLANLIAATAPNFGVMLVGRVLFGISLGGFWTVAVTLGGRLVPKAAMGAGYDDHPRRHFHRHGGRRSGRLGHRERGRLADGLHGLGVA
ncbi:MAG: MFS transporter [Lacunisphaera sp.]